MKTKNIVKLTAISLTALFSINISFAASTGKVKVSTANLREKADANSTVIDQISENQKVEILEKDGDWYKVKTKNLTGYLRQDLLEVTEEDTSEVEKTDTSANENKTDENKTEENKTDENTTSDNKETENEKIADNNEEQTQEPTESSKVRTVLEDTKIKIVPLINAQEISEVKKDEKLTVVEEINGWLHIEKEEIKGWIREEKLVSEESADTDTDGKTDESSSQPEESPEPSPDVTPNDTTEPEEETSEDTTTEELLKTMYVNSELVNVRKEASVSSDVVMKLNENTEVGVYAEVDEWYKVKVDGKEGYISKVLLSDNKKEVTSRSGTSIERAQNEIAVNSNNAGTAGTAIVNTANQYMGYKYVSGGTGPNSFDCSGFTKYVCSLNGVNIGRTAADQYYNGVAVSKEQLQLGDLVMFGSSSSSINHVGIYIGNGRMIHAANPKRGVVTDTINSGYYYDNYVGARRVV